MASRHLCLVLLDEYSHAVIIASLAFCIQMSAASWSSGNPLTWGLQLSSTALAALSSSWRSLPASTPYASSKHAWGTRQCPASLIFLKSSIMLADSLDLSYITQSIITLASKTYIAGPAGAAAGRGGTEGTSCILPRSTLSWNLCVYRWLPSRDST